MINENKRESGVKLPGNLAMPRDAKGIVLFAHGSGSSRFSPRNQQVAARLVAAGFGTLLFDLLTEDESFDRRNVFDISLLASRLVLATRWIQANQKDHILPLAYFGASTGAAAALWAAAELGNEISAVISRGGRPDLAISQLSQVTAPTLLLVGEYDEPVIEMNQEAAKHLSKAEIVIIPRATHLFEEPGALENVADEAVTWLNQYLKSLTSDMAA